MGGRRAPTASSPTTPPGASLPSVTSSRHCRRPRKPRRDREYCGHQLCQRTILRASGHRTARSRAVLLLSRGVHPREASARSRPATVRRARTLARRAGRPIVGSRRTTPPSRSSEPRYVWPGSPAPTTSGCRGSTTCRRGPSQVGLEHGVTTPGLGRPRPGRGADLLTLAQKAATGSVRFRLPEGRRRPGPVGGTQRSARRPPASRTLDRHGSVGERWSATHPPRRPGSTSSWPPATSRRTSRRPNCRPRGRGRDRGDSFHGAVPARLRPRRRYPGGVRRHVRHPGELPPHAGRAGRVQQRSWVAMFA